MTSPEVRAAAGLAALLPTDHPLAQLGRLRLDAAVRRQTQEHTMTETPDEQRARWLAAYDHTHDLAGHFIHLGSLQDASEPPCPGCGLHLPRDVRPSAHSLHCPAYAPHPDSIAAHQSTAPTTEQEPTP